MRFCAWILIATGLMFLVGCGSQPSTVTGTVKLDGKPLSSGGVTFHPVGTGASVTGQIDANGSYALSTGDEGGLVPGDYVATVVATEEAATPTDNSKAPAPPKLITPPIYGDQGQSPLKYQVKDGSNTIDIELTSKS